MITSGAVPYPCDRGMPMNVLGRGLHEFTTTEHGTVCRYCGKPPAEPSLGDRLRASN